MKQLAYLETGQTGGRKLLRLSCVTVPGNGAQVTIRESSETGLLVESSVRLTPGEEIELVLPRAVVRRLTVEWAGERYFGCNFVEPLAVETAEGPSAGMDALPSKGSPRAVSMAAHQLHELSQAIEKISSVLDRAMDQLSRRER